jgi:hypothetical protein
MFSLRRSGLRLAIGAGTDGMVALARAALWSPVLPIGARLFQQRIPAAAIAWAALQFTRLACGLVLVALVCTGRLRQRHTEPQKRGAKRHEPSCS